MATVAQVAKSSLQRILVQASEAPLEPDEYQDFIFSMNNYMAELDAQGIQLGYTVVSDLGDEVTIPTGALRGLIANMAIEVAPDYNGVVSGRLSRKQLVMGSTQCVCLDKAWAKADFLVRFLLALATKTMTSA